MLEVKCKTCGRTYLQNAIPSACEVCRSKDVLYREAKEETKSEPSTEDRIIELEERIRDLESRIETLELGVIRKT